MAGPKQTKRPVRDGAVTRRIFFRHTLLGTLVAAAAGGLGYLPRLVQSSDPVRPPGARSEDLFLGTCIKCGLCVQACPVDAIHLAPLSQGFGIGTPVIDTRAQACGYSCDQVDCLRACPTGALRRGGEGDAAVNPDQPIKPQAVPMGLAVLVSPEICLAVQGKPIQSYARESNFKGMLRVHRSTGWTERPVNKERYFRSICDLCAMECPITGAIRMKTQTDSKSGRAFLAPVVLPDCVGCGVCEMVCPTQPASIQIVAGKRHPDTVMTQPSRA